MSLGDTVDHVIVGSKFNALSKTFYIALIAMFIIQAGHLEWHSVEWSNPKLRPILDWSVEFSIQFRVQSGVQSKTRAYFGFGVQIALQKFRSAKCPAFRPEISTMNTLS